MSPCFIAMNQAYDVSLLIDSPCIPSVIDLYVSIFYIISIRFILVSSCVLCAAVCFEAPYSVICKGVEVDPGSDATRWRGNHRE